MTSITAMVPSNKENVTVQVPLSASADSKEPATAFAKLLDEVGDDSKKAHKTPAHPAYSFAELGMFGLHATAAASETDKKPAGAAKLLTPSADAAPREDQLRSTAAPAPLIYVPSLNVAASPMTVQPQVTSVAASGAHAVTPTATSTVLSPKPTTKAAAPATRTASASVPRQPANLAKKAVDPVAVTVAGTTDELHIAVRSQSQSPAEVVNMRRLVETTVAQFEMAIAELHINGQAGSDPTFAIVGGANGGRAG